MPEMAGLLGVTRQEIYNILRNEKYMHYFKSVIIADRKRIYRKGFEEFLAGQDQYQLKAPVDTKQYKCFFLIDERYAERVNDSVRGTDICEKYSSSTGRELIEADKKYFVVELEAPSNDQYTIVEKAFDAYRNEMGIVEFATAKVKELQNKVLVFDVYFNRFISLEREKYLA